MTPTRRSASRARDRSLMTPPRRSARRPRDRSVMPPPMVVGGGGDDLRTIDEEYKIWKKYTPFYYDIVITNPLEWPSFTVQWLPGREEPHGGDYSVQKLILGTHALEGNPNYLLLADVTLPSEDVEYETPEYDHKHGEVGGFSAGIGKVKIIQRINHNGGIDRARYMPQNSFIIATKTATGDLFVFDYRKHPAQPPADGACNPDLCLKGQNSEGYGLSWSNVKEGHLLSCGYDSPVCLWDINAAPANMSVKALYTLKVTNCTVEDVAWHSDDEHLFGSVSSNGYLFIWDLRALRNNRQIQSVVADKGRVNCLAFNPLNRWLVATGSVDKTVKLFDLRKLNTAIHSFEAHQDEIFHLGWNPNNGDVLASSCMGRRLMVWDISRIGEEQEPKEAIDGPPELIFIHAGHTALIPDFSWSPCENWLMASVAVDNVLQIWQISDSIYHDPAEIPPDSPEDVLP